MNYQIKFFNLLTICEKSGKLTKGFDVSGEAIKQQKAACVMITEDISPKTLKEINFMCLNKPWIKILYIPFRMDDIKQSIGKKVGVMAVCDKGFAKKFYEYAEAIKLVTKPE